MMPEQKSDGAVVIGAGINGLTAAAALARKGIAVTVLERGDGPGGMAAGMGGPGELAHSLRGPHPSVLAEFGISAGDLGLGPALATLALDPGGRHVVLGPEGLKFADGGAHPDAAAYARLDAQLSRFAGVLAPLLIAAPPRFGGWKSRAGFTQLSRLGRIGLGARRLGKAEMREFLRVMLSNAADVLLDALPDGPVAGALALDAVMGAKMGPRSPGTVVTLLYRLMQGNIYRPAGGMRGLASRLAHAAEARGVSIRYGASVEAVEIEDDRVAGIRLAGGEHIPASAVLSSLGALPTISLAGAAHFDAETCRRVRQIRTEGVTARVDIPLDSMPELPASMAPEGIRIVAAPSIAAVERAFDPVKYGSCSPAPVIEALLVPEGQGAKLSALVQWVPANAGDEARSILASAVQETLGRALSGFQPAGDPVVQLPADIAQTTGVPGGHWHHGEIALDQLLTLRPANGVAEYATGLPGLFFCGASAHPGGDITGLPGRNAARAMLEGVSA